MFWGANLVILGLGNSWIGADQDFRNSSSVLHLTDKRKYTQIEHMGCGQWMAKKKLCHTHISPIYRAKYSLMCCGDWRPMKCACGIPYPVSKCCCLPRFMGRHTHISWFATTQGTFCSIYRADVHVAQFIPENAVRCSIWVYILYLWFHLCLIVVCQRIIHPIYFVFPLSHVCIQFCPMCPLPVMRFFFFFLSR